MPLVRFYFIIKNHHSDQTPKSWKRKQNIQIFLSKREYDSPGPDILVLTK